jgi:hypothetical protein
MLCEKLPLGVTMLLSAEEVVFVEPAVLKYLRWTYVLIESHLSEVSFKVAFVKHSDSRDNFVALRQKEGYNIYVAVEGELPPAEAAAEALVEEYFYYRGVKTKRMVKPLPSLAALTAQQPATVEGDYIYYRGVKTKIVKRMQSPEGAPPPTNLKYRGIKTN